MYTYECYEAAIKCLYFHVELFQSYHAYHDFFGEAFGHVLFWSAKVEQIKKELNLND